MLNDYGIILLFFLMGVVFVALGLITAAIIRPSHPNPIKQSTYECGEIPWGNSWIRFNIRFYVIALIFLLFDVEVVFLLPWAIVFKQLGWFAFYEMIVFVVILLAGLAYVWAKGDLDWDKPKPFIPILKDMIFTKKEEL
jgi:NADH-quinone oxidoreductase subunit A